MTDDQHDQVLGRLEREREQAERRYVAALAALDAAAEPPPALTASAAAGESDVARLNQIWTKYGPPAGDRSPAGLMKRIVAEIGRLLPWRRRALNGAMVAAINRQAEATRALIDATRHFQSHVVWYGQTVAAFSATHRRGNVGAQGVEAVHAALDALALDWMKHWDALQARELRQEARTAALTKAYDELREVASLAQQSTLALKRIVESRLAGGPAAVATAAAAPGASRPAAPDADAFKYVTFEDRFRGTREEIRRRLADYVPIFAGATDVLDIGCGRGELLDLFREHGIAGRGIDLNDDMVEACRARGLTADRADALAYVSALPDQSLGGLIAIQVVEHLEPGYLMRLLETAHHKLRPGAPLVLETINAACWTAFFDSYIRDFTHARPLHPETLRYLVQASGFGTVDIQYRSPVADQDKLPSVRLPAPRPGTTPDPAIADVVEALNAHAERLNARLFTHRDFAILARK